MIQDIRILCNTDNKSLVESIYSSKQVNDRRLRLDVNVIENMLARGKTSIKVKQGSRVRGPQD